MTNEIYDRKHKPQKHRWTRKLLFWFGGGIILYLIIGVLIVPPIARNLILGFTENNLNCTAELGSVGFNPLSLAITADDFSLFDSDKRPLLSIAETYINPDLLPLINGVIRLDSLAVANLSVNLLRNPDSTFNFGDLPEKLIRQIAYYAGKDGPWDLVIDRFSAHNAGFAYEDLTAEISFLYVADSIQFDLRDLNMFSPDTAAWRVSLKPDGGGTASAEGILRTDSIMTAFSFASSGLSLLPFQSLLRRFALLRIESGNLNAHGRVKLNLDSLFNPAAIDYSGNLSVCQLNLSDLSGNELFMKWDTLSTSGITAKFEPAALNIGEITIQKFYAKIAIAKDLTFNLADVLQPLIQKTGSDPEFARMINPRKIDLNIGRITVLNSSCLFSDQSLPLPFAILVHAFNANISEISSINPQQSNLAFDGRVGRQGYAGVKGVLDPFDPLAMTDADAVFTSIDLVGLTPYAAKFAGYTLKNGDLSMEVSYKLREGKLKGSNQVLLHQMELGEEIESASATGLPVKLAVALLKDSEGNIDLDVEVTGDLNDPRIDMEQLVGAAVQKVIINAVSAPFTFLGTLLGVDNGAEMEFINFAPGSSELPAYEMEKLANLKRAMELRREIKLKIYAAYDAKADRQAIQNAKFKRLYRSRQAAEKNSDSTGQMSDRDLLERLYQEVFPQHELDNLQSDHNMQKQDMGMAREVPDSRQRDIDGYLAVLKERLIGAQVVPEAELIGLARDRAQQISMHLTDIHGISQARIVYAGLDLPEDRNVSGTKCRLAIDHI